ncbi:ABC-F family ATP-binding cassette domain-containing protein [Amycolatopsis umgeniensis]|uniref:ATPase subunit of ABC transporter with duplicated ATPase domains n=1 Tax=Amycolatopsis umgeniensis TaxID=336628 RepID=A0A841BAD4_9PSEU|nr:ATP-binding cassette domain-containing protein [Amycolatopsis umgeniensis]MBB5855825.1 ATPase subunit of ABC transporter with duplicated ATPase domains [Amycolatopsis umgeniensis]
MSSSLTFSDVTFTWPDGTGVFERLSLTIGAGRTGLVGTNGSGKSTLLRLLAGGLKATSGSITTPGELGYLPQNLVLDTGRRVDDVLGVTALRSAIRAVESGATAEEHFTTIGDNWDVEERIRAILDRLGLDAVRLDQRAGELSGGELTLLGLAALLLRRPAALLLDEPTNNLDLRARELVHREVEGWGGILVVVSHDRELLRLVDRIVEVRDSEVTTYGGDLDDYEHAVEVAQEAARRHVRAAESHVKRQKRELIEAGTTLARRARYGQKMWDRKREPKGRMRKRQEDAQIAAGKYRNLHTGRLEDAVEALKAAEELVREDAEIRVELPETTVARGTDVLRIDAEPRFGPPVNLHVMGPERIALVGPNGSGKTTLLRTITGELPPRSGEARLFVPARLLPQRIDILDDTMSIVDNVRLVAPSLTDNEIRARLARFLFRGKTADREVASLSGGERFRAALAALLLTEPTPKLLLLDEPTNNLDLASVRRLTEALLAYRGTLIVASHDRPFLKDIGITRWLGTH